MSGNVIGRFSFCAVFLSKLDLTLNVKRKAFVVAVSFLDRLWTSLTLASSSPFP
jgi:hypothetical protein